MHKIDLFGHTFTVSITVDPKPESFENKRKERRFKPGVHCHLLDAKGKTVARGSAYCNPTDTFNPEYGTKIAFQRAIDRAAEGIVKGAKTRLTNDLFGPF